MDNTIASTLKNCPISKAFILKVDLSTGNAYPRQTFLQFNNGKVFTRVFDAFENKWSETFSNITNADLMIFGGAKSVAIATETNIVHMYFYTDEIKQNGYRIDVNGATKRLSLLRITNGSSAEICGVGMS